MQYSSKRANETYKTLDEPKTFFIAGINEDVTLASIETGKSKSGKDVLNFNFERGTQKYQHTEWAPMQSQYSTMEEQADKQYKKIEQIFKALFNDAELNFDIEADSFTDFAAKVAAAYNFYKQSKSTSKLRVKMIYDNNGYLNLPKNGYQSTFIEPMTVSKEDSKITKNSGDHFERPAVKEDDIKIKSISPNAAQFNITSTLSDFNTMPF
jgi:hypothetical protein